VADRSSDLMLAALSRAAVEPAGLPLFAGRSDPGLFPSTAAAKPIARRAIADGFLAVVGPAGKRGEVCRVTDAGLKQLHAAADPKPILEDFVRVLEERRRQADELLAAARQMTESLSAMSQVVGGLLPKVTSHRAILPPCLLEGEGPGVRGDSLADSILAHLADWSSSATGGQDCPLPDLYRAVTAGHPSPSVGRFHDALRRLHADRRVYLHPWTGPLYTLPEPGFALLIGHDVSYYASIVSN
jgi:hypothetical protein